MSAKLLSFRWYNGNVRAIVSFLLEDNLAVNKREKCMVFAHAYVLSGIVLGAALANDDVAGDAVLTSEDLNA